MRFLILLAMALAGTMVSSAEAAPQARPNILFLFADDQRADTIGALGNPAIRTPHLDRLVASGLTLRNAYCLGSNMPAVCTPSRNMLLCGRAYFRWTGPQAPVELPNLPDALRAAGYETFHHGKRGNVATAINQRFDHNLYVEDEHDRTNGQPARDIVDSVIRFLETRERGRPFFAYLAFSNPHDPRVAADEYRDQYRAADIPLPRNFLPQHPFDNGEMAVRDERLAPWPRTAEEIRRHLHDYYAVISAMDRHIGRLLDRLDALGLRENTVVIYSADSGLALGSHGLLGKQNVYEDTLRVPLVVSGPGIRQGRSEALVYLLDLFPTLCELAGAPVPDGLDGRSFAGQLRGEPGDVRETLGLAYRDVQRSIRDDRWKLIRYPQVDVTQLFDLRDDPAETRDRSGEPAQAERIARLLDQLQSWQRQFGDDAPLRVPSPRPRAWTPPAAD